jgi:hypothetical protein
MPALWPLPVLVCAAALSGCDGNGTTRPSAPTQGPTLNVTGRWVGDLTIQNVTGRMTWTLSQSETSVTGPVLIGLATGTVLLNGTLTGMLNGSSLSYSIDVAPNGIPAQPTCTGQLVGTMTVSTGPVPTMIGPIGVASSTCPIQFTTSTVTLTRGIQPTPM